jgi:hypothetical protein
MVYGGVTLGFSHEAPEWDLYRGNGSVKDKNYKKQEPNHPVNINDRFANFLGSVIE